MSVKVDVAVGTSVNVGVTVRVYVGKPVGTSVTVTVKADVLVGIGESAFSVMKGVVATGMGVDVGVGRRDAKTVIKPPSPPIAITTAVHPVRMLGKEPQKESGLFSFSSLMELNPDKIMAAELRL